MALNLTLHKTNTGEINENLIILIHGIGAPNTTWNNNGISWIDLFLTDEQLPKVDVANVVYDTAHLANGILDSIGIKKLKLGKFRGFSIGKGPFTTLEILARELKREIDAYQIKAYKKVILVGHSMGGLIAIRYLLEEIEHNQNHNVKGFTSLATPYNGSSFALYAELIKSINKHAQIPSLEPNSIFLDETIRLWQKHLEKIDIDFKFFFGTNDNVVSENSAIPHIVSSKWTGGVPLPGDHSSILTVYDCNSTSYKNVSEFIKDVIEKESPLKKKQIDGLRTHSRARCLARYQANGLTKEQAVYLLDNIKYDYDYVEPTTENRLSVIVGEFGVGKSFVVDLIFQKLLDKAELDSNLGIPLFLSSSQVINDFQGQIEPIMETAENEGKSEQWIIIDGMDEIPISLASKALDEVRIAIERWDNLKVVITSRPLSIFNGIPEKKVIQPLSEQKILNIVNFISGKENNFFRLSRFPKSVKDAIKRPLFAIIFGLYLKKSNMNAPTTTGELLTYLIEHSLEKVKINEERTKNLLKELAILTTNRGNIPIKRNEIGVIDEIKGLLDSGLVVEDNGYLSFVLPILTQWFAAQALSEKLIDVDNILEKENNLDYWKYAIIILITVFKETQIDGILAKIVEENPGFASILIEEGIANWGMVSSTSLPSSMECGEKIRLAMESWVKGLGILSNLIAPIQPNGEVLPIGVSTDDVWLNTSWYQGSKNVPKVNDLALEGERILLTDWPNHRGAMPGDNLSWHWRWAMEELRDNLTKKIGNKILPICSEIIYKELMWSATLKITKKGSLYSKKIPVEEVQEKLNKEYKNASALKLRNNILPLDIFRDYLEGLNKSGVKMITSPLPGADIEEPSDNWVWSVYSSERLRLRTVTVFKEAIIGYREMVEALFPSIKNRLRRYVLYPYILKGELDVPFGRNDYASGPTLGWYMEPLPIHGNFEVDINLKTDSNSQYSRLYDDTIANELHEKIKKYRPYASEWLYASYTGQALDIYEDTPVTDLIYEWLKKDLKSLYWIK